MVEQKALAALEVVKASVVCTPGAEQPYKAVLHYRDGRCAEHPVSTVRDGEALIRSKGGWDARPADDLRPWNEGADEPPRLYQRW